MTPGSDESTIRLLELFLETMQTLTRQIREEYVPDDDRQEILEARSLAQQLSDQIRSGQAADDLVPVVEALTDKLQLSTNLLLNASSGNPDQLSAQELNEEARIAFYTLRAHLFPDGKVWTS